MNKTDSIPAFPPELDRDSFGHWLSGFTDGEASFGLMISNQHACNVPYANFAIKLRSDDLEILNLIRSYFGVGRLSFQSYSDDTGKKFCSLVIARTMDLDRIIVPHFEKFPLRAKKANDFVIWKQGVALLASIWHRPQKLRSPYGGTLPRWSQAERDFFKVLHDSLRSQRLYNSPPIPVEPFGKQLPELFD